MHKSLYDHYLFLFSSQVFLINYHCLIGMLIGMFRYLAFKYKIKSNYWQEDWKHIERCIFNYAETTRSDSDYYVGNTVRELCLTRSADFILDTAELNVLIHHLCTS